MVFYLALLMRDAVDDIAALGFTPDLAALNDRFMRWINRPIDLNERAARERPSPGSSGASPRSE
ncbi:hypothetical protein [Micromonospora sp. NPDC003241]